MVCLTDLWKAAGSEHSKQTDYFYTNVSTQELLEEFSKNSNSRNSGVWTSKKGRYGGTYAHWQIALAYTKWISPAFHIAVNKIYMQHTHGDPEAITDAIKLVPAAYRKKSMPKIRSLITFYELEQALVDKGAFDEGQLHKKKHIMNALYVGVFGMDAVHLREEYSLGHRANVKDNLPDSDLNYLTIAESTAAQEIWNNSDVFGYDACLSQVKSVSVSIGKLRTSRLPKPVPLQTKEQTVNKPHQPIAASA